MGNLNCHESDAVRKAIKDRGTEQRFLPPAVPIPTPVEQVFAKPKH